MLFLLNLLGYMIPIAITVILFIIYYNVFVLGYAKRIKRAMDSNQIEKAERMKQIALKRQPKKMNKLLLKMNVIKKHDPFSNYEIESISIDKDNTFTIEQQLTIKDRIDFENWFYLKRIPLAAKIIMLIGFGCLILIFLTSAVSVFVPIIFLVCAIIVIRIMQILKHKSYPNEAHKIILCNDKVIYCKQDKLYDFKRDFIKQIFVTKRGIYILWKNGYAISIPKRFIKEYYSTMMEYIKNLKPDYRKT